MTSRGSSARRRSRAEPEPERAWLAAVADAAAAGTPVEWLGQYLTILAECRRTGASTTESRTPSGTSSIPFGMSLGRYVLLWLYTLSCHVCRHAVRGRINHFSAHPIRYRFWTIVTKINPYCGNLAWASLIWVGIADGYIRPVASGTIRDPRLF
jgi:hypothetical protein